MMKFYGQFDPPVDRFIFERYFPDLGTQGVFVECGAFDGQTECSCRFFEETMGWKGYNLEPVPWIYERLTQNRPMSSNLNVGLSDRTGTQRFQSVVHPVYGRDTTIGAVEHSPALKEYLIAQGCTFEEITINVLAWNDFIHRQKISRIDLMVLDVEGHEASVLDGMRDSDVLPSVMCVEVGHSGFGILRDILAEMGYEYDVSSNANAFFLRRDVLPLFAFRSAAQPKTAVALPIPDEIISRADLDELISERDQLLIRLG
ncbi:FkbM family methyltransferase [Microvirga tunisiensis]|uniref:FkbM family methyltransferase n=1 Tax=Microvirga tunisiensis TaxID=2108360 RepID=A0A5N7MRF1_9HYPH|nr:FkbM family methyltransferase [Microvirga tunisiensis]MPR11573.1 FkbM family methyltransferase [Microvirga tunisiensis]MPR29587.1 FkbM family methyltransferase [Microvirga tunisiensis]